MKKRIWMLLAVAVMLLSVATACMSGGAAEEEQERVLRIGVLYGDGGYNQHVRTEYTDIFDYAHPNIEIEIVSAMNYNTMNNQGDEEQPTPLEAMKEMMEGANPPDVVMMGLNELSGLAEENLLLPLESYMTEDNFLTDDIAPAVIEGLKSAGNGELYALAPTFNSSALIYNRDIFTAEGVQVPEDGMTWEETFDLARRVTNGEANERTFGFSFTRYVYNDLFSQMQAYAAPLNIRMFDDNTRLMVNTDQWARVWNTLTGLYTEEVLPTQPDYSQQMEMPQHQYSHDYFISGRTAMSVVSYGELNDVMNIMNNAGNIEGLDTFDWDVVTMPVHQEAPGIGGQVYMDSVMGINAKAENLDDAWRLISFINGEEWAKIRSKSSYQLVSRAEFNEPLGGLDINLDAFYALEPAPTSEMNDIYMNNPNAWQVQHIGQMKFDEVIQGNLTVEEALAQWENEGNSMLDQLDEQQGDQGMSDLEALQRASGEVITEIAE